MTLDKMAIVKKVINSFVPLLGGQIPEIKEVKRPITKEVRKLFKLFDASLKSHPDRFYADGNFPRLLEVTERALVFLCESDGHYAGWVAQAFHFIYHLTAESRKEVLEGLPGSVLWLEYMAQHKVSSAQKVEVE